MRVRVVVVLASALLAIPARAPGSPAPFAFDPRGLSANRFQAVTQPERVDVRAHDGVMLHARVFRPDTSSVPTWKTPVILVHSPYFDSAVVEATSANDRAMNLVDYFTPKGYTVVLSDVRGTGDSGGCLEQDGTNQARDFKTLVEHFASQPWSSGRVGSYGKSYDGETQNAGAVLRPTGLVTMVTIAAISGLYDVAYFDGVPYRGSGLASAALYAEVGAEPPGRPQNAPRESERFACQPANVVNAADPSGDMKPYWLEREFRTGVQRVQATVLYVQGFADANVLPINIDGWYDALPTFKRAMFGQWQHRIPDDDAGAAFDRFARDDWMRMVHAWYDHELLGLKTGIERWPPVQVQDERNVWRAARSFASLGTQQTLSLGEGVLGRAARPGTAVTFAEDGTASWDGGTTEHPLHLSGQIVLEAVITLDRDDAHLALTVSEVSGDVELRDLTRGYLSARHRRSLRAGEPVPVGEPVRYRIRTLPFDATLSKGSRLRIALSGSDADTLPAGTRYQARVAVDGSSKLHVPVADEGCGLRVTSRQRARAAIPSCASPWWLVLGSRVDRDEPDLPATGVGGSGVGSALLATASLLGASARLRHLTRGTWSRDVGRVHARTRRRSSCSLAPARHRRTP